MAMGEFFESWNLHVRSLLTPRFASFRLRSQNPNKSPSSLRLEFDRFGYEAKVRVSTKSAEDLLASLRLDFCTKKNPNKSPCEEPIRTVPDAAPNMECSSETYIYAAILQSKEAKLRCLFRP